MATDTIDLGENLGAAEVQTIADDLEVGSEVSVPGVDSVTELQRGVPDLVGTGDIETVVLRYEADSFAGTVLLGSTTR